MSGELHDRALITVEEGRRYCWRNEDDNSRDGILIDAINDISDEIWDYCGREFKPTTGTTATTADPGSGGLTLAVASAEGFPTTNGYKILVDSEIMLVTAGAGTLSWTVTRAQDGTTAAAHTTGAAVAEIEGRIFRYGGSGHLDLHPYDLRTLASAVLYTDLDTAQQATLTADQYRLEPRGQTPAGTYLGLKLPYPALVEAEYGFGWEITVTGSWGMNATPGGVKLACKQWVDNIVRNPGSYASHAMSGYTVIPEVDDRRPGMPPAVRHRLDRWRRRTSKAFSVVRFGHTGSAPGVPHTLPTV